MDRTDKAIVAVWLVALVAAGVMAWRVVEVLGAYAHFHHVLQYGGE